MSADSFVDEKPLKFRKLTLELVLEQKSDRHADVLQLQAIKEFWMSFDNWIGHLYGVSDFGAEELCNKHVRLMWRTEILEERHLTDAELKNWKPGAVRPSQLKLGLTGD